MKNHFSKLFQKVAATLTCAAFIPFGAAPARAQQSTTAPAQGTYLVAGQDILPSPLPWTVNSDGAKINGDSITCPVTTPCGESVSFVVPKNGYYDFSYTEKVNPSNYNANTYTGVYIYQPPIIVGTSITAYEKINYTQPFAPNQLVPSTPTKYHTIIFLNETSGCDTTLVAGSNPFCPNSSTLHVMGNAGYSILAPSLKYVGPAFAALPTESENILPSFFVTGKDGWDTYTNDRSYLPDSNPPIPVSTFKIVDDKTFSCTDTVSCERYYSFSSLPRSVGAGTLTLVLDITVKKGSTGTLPPGEVQVVNHSCTGNGSAVSAWLNFPSSVIDFTMGTIRLSGAVDFPGFSPLSNVACERPTKSVDVVIRLGGAKSGTPFEGTMSAMLLYAPKLPIASPADKSTSAATPLLQRQEKIDAGSLTTKPVVPLPIKKPLGMDSIYNN